MGFGTMLTVLLPGKSLYMPILLMLYFMATTSGGQNFATASYHSTSNINTIIGLARGTYYFVVRCGVAPPASINSNKCSIASFFGDTNTNEKSVLVKDTIRPTVTDHQSGDDTVRTTDPGAIYDVDFSDTGGSNLKNAQYTVWSGAGMTRW